MSSNSERTDLSIIIINYNTAQLVCDCINSIACGIKRYSRHIYVVDNGSRDNSVQIIEKSFPEVTIIKNSKNLGFAKANNQALRVANSSFYLLLNSDTIVTADAIDKTLDFMTVTPDCGFVSPQLLNNDGTLQNTIANFPNLLTELTNKSLLRIIFPTKYSPKNSSITAPIQVKSLVGAALFASEAMCNEIGYYCEDFFFFFEETEWCKRAINNNWKCYLFPNTQIFHLQGQTAKQAPIAVRIEYWRSRYTYFIKCYPKYVVILLISGLLLKNTGNFFLNLLASPFSKKSRHKLKLSLTIFKWHLKGCPKEMGISTS